MNSTNIPNKLVDGEFKKFDISLETTAYKKRPA